MTTIYLHIGMPKTGTTSLQKFLFDNREKLLEKGYLYPISGTKITSPRRPQRYSHNKLAHELGRTLIQKTDQKGNWVSKCSTWEECKREINTIKPTNVIISAEDFTKPQVIYNSDIITLTKKKLEEYDTKIVIYLRRQDEFLKSFYCFLIPSVLRTDIKEFILEWKHLTDYYKTIELWKDVFGVENIIVRVFEKEQMVNCNLYEDFFATINPNSYNKMDLEFTQGSRKNLSVYSGKAIKLINLIDKMSRKIPFKAKQSKHKSYFIRRLILNNKTSKLMSYLPENFIFNEELLSKQDRTRPARQK